VKPGEDHEKQNYGGSKDDMAAVIKSKLDPDIRVMCLSVALNFDSRTAAQKRGAGHVRCGKYRTDSCGQNPVRYESESQEG